MLSIIYRDLISARAPVLITYSAAHSLFRAISGESSQRNVSFWHKTDLISCFKLSFIDVLLDNKDSSMCNYSNALYTTSGQGQTPKYNHNHVLWSLAIFRALKSNWEITYGSTNQRLTTNIAYNSSRFRLLIGLLVWRTHLILSVRWGFMSPIVSVSVGGITALRVWHHPTIDWLDSYPGTYIVMTAPVHVQCLSCCLCNLWEVMAVAVSVVYRTLALTPHIKTVIKVTPAPVLMGLIPCHHTWCQKCT